MKNFRPKLPYLINAFLLISFPFKSGILILQSNAELSATDRDGVSAESPLRRFELRSTVLSLWRTVQRTVFNFKDLRHRRPPPTRPPSRRRRRRRRLRRRMTDGRRVDRDISAAFDRLGHGRRSAGRGVLLV